MKPSIRSAITKLAMISGCLASQNAFGQSERPAEKPALGFPLPNAPVDQRAPEKSAPEKPANGAAETLPVPPLKEGESFIDLPTALRLAGVQNPDILFARERVTEALAIRQLAAAQALPNINVGLNYNLHRGPGSNRTATFSMSIAMPCSSAWGPTPWRPAR